MSMEPPLKRRRISGSSYPESDLHARRAQNDLRLKSIFESIFEKYGKDFDGIGDEIDMETGEIVVNNGHVLGMTNEGDVGDAEYSSEELGNSDDEDEHSSTEYSEEHEAALGPSKARDATVIEGSEAYEQSDFDADSLMGDVPAESHLHQLGKESRRAISIPKDDEEDELASSDIEWVSHSKERLGTQERWCFSKDKHTFADEPAFEPAWKAPPLPKIPLFKKDREDVALAIIDTTREYSDDERAGISLWTPEVKKYSRRRRESANSLTKRSLSFARGQENHEDGVLSNLSYSEPAGRRVVKWTHEEEELLIHLKTTTNLSCPAMESYFPKRHGNAIGSHWNYMISVGKASPKPRKPTGFEDRTPPPGFYPSINPLAPDGTRQESCYHDTLSSTKKPQSVQQHLDRGFSEKEILVRSSSRPVEQLGDHRMNPQYQVSGDLGTPSGHTVDEPILISDDTAAHIGCIMGKPFSSAKKCETTEDSTVDEFSDGASEPSTRTSDHYHPVEKIHNHFDQNSIYRDQEGTLVTKGIDPPQTSACRTSDTAGHVDGGYKTAEFTYQMNLDESYADTDQSRCLSKALEIEDDVVMCREKYASNLPDQALEAVSENGFGARISSPTTSIKAEPDCKGAHSCSGGIISPEIQPWSIAAMEASNAPQTFQQNYSKLEQEDSIPTTAERNIQRKRSTAEGPQKTGPTKLVSSASPQPPNHGEPSAPQEHNVELSKKNSTKRQIVQVVIPLAASSNAIRKSGGTPKRPLSHPHARSPLATIEADPAFIRHLSATAESTPAALGPILPNQEILVVRTPTRSPSVAVAESQYAASAASVLNDVRSALGPEIADSQPLSTVPAIATPAPDLGGEATRPIILDAESQSLRMTPGVALSPRTQPKKATETIILDSDSPARRVTPGIAAPARSGIEEAIESDIVESGSHTLGETLSAARSALKKVKKGIAADSFSSIWTAIDDYSEDELSYL